MTTPQTTACGTIYDKVAIAYLQHVGRSTAPGPFGPAVPRPAVVADETAAACAEGVVLTVAFGYGRRVVNVRLSNLCRSLRERKKTDAQ